MADDQGRPAGLMAGAEAAAGFGVEVFVEEDEVPPVRVVAKALADTQAGAGARAVRPEEAGEAGGNVAGDFAKREPGSGAGGTFHLEAVAVEVVVAFQGLDEEVVHRKPDRPPPVGVAAEKARGGFPRLVVHAMFLTAGGEDEGMGSVMLGERTNAEGGEKLLFIEQVAQHAGQPFARRDGQQAAGAVSHAVLVAVGCGGRGSGGI